MNPLGQAEDAAVERLLEAVLATYHYDFRGYVRSSLRRRVAAAQSALGCSDVEALSARVIADPESFAQLLGYLTIQVSDLFRDPAYWRALRRDVIPHLSTYPFIRIWVAGCGAGEEAYSMAILLAEAGLLERAQIYATDVAQPSLDHARSGIYDRSRLSSYSAQYYQAGGVGSLSDHYTAAYQKGRFAPSLRRRILFAEHNLATDVAFAEVQLISCRNVMIYFDAALQQRVHRVFWDSLCPRGFLGLGANETLTFTAEAARYEVWSSAERIYRRTERS
jgi:chemotaxis protein methyltransferase CheR